MKFLSLILASCLFFSPVQAQAKNFLFDATSFDPQPVMVAAANNLVPTGTVMIWTQEIIPEGWLECNGQSVPSNCELYKTMKKTPNYQGMFLRGSGSQTINHGSYGLTVHSAVLGEIQGDTIRNIKGGFDGNTNDGDWHKTGPFFNTSELITGSDGGGVNATGGGIIGFNTSLTVPTSEENRPVNIGVKYIIKAE